MDEVQTGADAEAEATDVAGVLRDLGVDQRDVEEGLCHPEPTSP